MFKYILLGSLLVHTIWAKPVEHNVEPASHVVIVTPQAQLSLESLIHGNPVIHHSPFVRYVAPHEESIVYVPASAIQQRPHQQNIGRSSDGVHGKQFNGQQLDSNLLYTPYQISELQIQQQQQRDQQQKLQQLRLEQLVLQQKQRIEILEQELKNLYEKQAQHGSTLIELETPLGGAKLSSNIVETVAPAINIIPNLLQPILKQKSVGVFGHEPHHQYVVEQPRHVVEYIPVVVNPAPVTPTIKARRSVLSEVQDDVKIIPVEENKQAQAEQVIPIIAKLSSDISSAQQQVAAIAAEETKGIESVIDEQARSLEADKQIDEQKQEDSSSDKKPAAAEKPTEIPLENNNNAPNIAIPV